MILFSDIWQQFARSVRVLNGSLLSVFAISILVMAATTDDPMARRSLCSALYCFESVHADFWNSIFHTLSSGAVLSVLFYWVFVRVPEHQKKQRAKNLFKAQYTSFKLQCIDIFLVLSKSQNEISPVERLLSPREFKLFFKGLNRVGEDRWATFLNGLNQYYIDALARKMENLRDEFRFFLLSADTKDEEIQALLNRFAEATYYQVPERDDYDEVKSLSQYFWQLFAGWSFIDGYRDDDFLIEAIERF